MKLQMLLMKVMQFMGAITDKDGKPWTSGDKYKDGINYGNSPNWVIEVIAPIISILNSLLVPVIILLGTAGMIYGIVLGVQYSKAETADKREELKKRLISAVVGILIALVALILLKIFVQNAGAIFGWVRDEAGETPTGTASGSTNP